MTCENRSVHPPGVRAAAAESVYYYACKFSQAAQIFQRCNSFNHLTHLTLPPPSTLRLRLRRAVSICGFPFPFPIQLPGLA